MPGLFDAPSGANRPRSRAAEPDPPGPRTLSVGQLTGEVARRLGDLGRVRVEGELSGIKRAGSGHVYFALKDRDASISCAVWRSRAARAIRFDLEEGLQVVAEGKLDVYAPRGTYSLIVERLEPKGIGALLAQLERLKAELRERGWFDRARPLPFLPRTVGLVTSRDTAALQDVLRTRSLRWPGYPLRLCHTPVQGPTAAGSIARAIARLDASGVDVIVVARGGGSLEDLWCFNELPVAEAIHACGVPVVSGVGHETDVTLADLVADHRAHTPTDAAQTVLPERALLTGALERLGAHLVQAADDALLRREERLQELRERPALRDPLRLWSERERQLEALARRGRGALERNLAAAGTRLAGLRASLERQSPRATLARFEQRLSRAGTHLTLSAPRLVERREDKLGRLAAALEAYSPLKVLGRGYSLTTRVEDGRPVTDADDVAIGDELETRLARGRLRTRVESAEADDAGPRP